MAFTSNPPPPIITDIPRSLFGDTWVASRPELTTASHGTAVSKVLKNQRLKGVSEDVGQLRTKAVFASTLLLCVDYVILLLAEQLHC